VLLSSIFRKCLANLQCKNEREKEDTHVTPICDLDRYPSVILFPYDNV